MSERVDPPNETEAQRRLPRASVDRSGSILIIGKRDRAAGNRWSGLFRQFGNILKVLLIGGVDEFPGSFVVAARKRAVYRNHLFQCVWFIQLKQNRLLQRKQVQVIANSFALGGVLLEQSGVRDGMTLEKDVEQLVKQGVDLVAHRHRLRGEAAQRI